MAFGTNGGDAGKSPMKEGSSTETAVFLLLVLMLSGFLLSRFLFADPAGSGRPDAEPAAMQGRVSDAGGQPQPIAGQRRCEFFILQKILSARDPVVLGHWDINGKRVFRVGFSMSGRSDDRDRLCVYDLETRSALLPAIDDQYRWRRGASDASSS